MTDTMTTTTTAERDAIRSVQEALGLPLMPEVAITDEQREEFRENGVIRLRGVIAEEEVELLRSAVARQLDDYAAGRSPSAYNLHSVGEQIFAKTDALQTGGASRFDAEMYRQLVQSDEGARWLADRPAHNERAEGEENYLWEAGGWRRQQEVRRVAMDSLLPRLTAELMGSSYINFWEDTTFTKTAGANTRTAFHQDLGYFQVDGSKICIAWVPLDPVDEHNGALEYVIGSHKWSERYAPNVFFAQTTVPGAEDPRLPDIEANRDQYDIRRIDAEPGDVIIHDVLTIHGAGGNTTLDRDRRAVSFRYCGDDVVYKERPGALNQPWVSHDLKDGDRLLTPDYPLVWPKVHPVERISDLYQDQARDGTVWTCPNSAAAAASRAKADAQEAA